MIVYFCTDTQDKKNSYGLNPKESLQK
nr:hypothetical protein [Sporolactobacillus inulinus]